MILATGCYNVVDGAGTFIVEGVKGNYDIFATAAVDSMFSGFGIIFISFAMFLFTFSTVMAYSVYLRGVYHYFFSKPSQGHLIKKVGLAVNIAIVILAFFGPLISSQTIWNLASALCGIIFLVNIICLVFLFKPGAAVLKDYERQLKKGIDPVFIPENCGIKNAELWHEIIENNYSDELKAYHNAFSTERKN